MSWLLLFLCIYWFFQCSSDVYCFLVSCPLLSISNGAVSSTSVYPGVVITVTCNDGYILNGPSAITCLLNGTWSKQIPTCKAGKDNSTIGYTHSLSLSIVSCPNLPLLSHLIPVVSSTTNTPGTIVRYHCENGYAIIGQATIMCQANGRYYTSKRFLEFHVLLFSIRKMELYITSFMYSCTFCCSCQSYVHF